MKEMGLLWLPNPINLTSEYKETAKTSLHILLYFLLVPILYSNLWRFNQWTPFKWIVFFSICHFLSSVYLGFWSLCVEIKVSLNSNLSLCMTDNCTTWLSKIQYVANNYIDKICILFTETCNRWSCREWWHLKSAAKVSSKPQLPEEFWLCFCYCSTLSYWWWSASWQSYVKLPPARISAAS